MNISEMPSFFTFCPNCKSENITFEKLVKFHCKDCDFQYYHNIAAAVAVVFTFEDKILFSVRKVNPDKGKLDLPGGFIDPSENAEQAVCREIKEELGLYLDITQLKYITTAPNNYLYKNVPYRTMDIFYEVALKSDQVAVAAEDEIESLIWIKKSKIELNEIGFVSIRKVINKFYLS
jgi:NAD+ diphosphatase